MEGTKFLMMDFLERFKENLSDKHLVNNNDKLLLGVSGGPDSLTMLDLFYKIKEDLNLSLLVFHLNHSFREESDEEAEFVKRFCDKRQIEAIIKKYDVPHYIKENNLSPEEGAREVRFKFLKEIYQKRDFDKISLAHNKDDLVETILFNIFRGTGMRGLKGIEDKLKYNGMELIHPILIFYRSEILDYCKYNNLNPVFDPSNESNLYSRNRIRNNILPLIENQINENAKKVIAQMSETIKEDYAFIQTHSHKLLEDILMEKSAEKYILNLKELKEIHPAIIKRILNIILKELKGNVDNFYYKHYSDIIRFIEENKTGDILDLPDNINLKISYDKLFVLKGAFESKETYSQKITEEGEYTLPFNQKLVLEFKDDKLDWRNYKDKNYCLIDYDKVTFPLKVRNRKQGDKFIPLGMEGHKKVKDFFIDSKVPDYKRDEIPLLFDNNNRLIWICGYRMDDRFKLEEDSKKTILVKYQKEENN
mgnify:FL=1